MTTEVHRVVLYVVDHDQVGAADVREMLEHTRYPNRCIAPHVVSVETQAVEWDDDHPLNTRATAAATFAELFPAAADKARAVDLDAITLAADLIGRHLAPTSDVARGAVARLEAMLAGKPARPTPDEARRLIDAAIAGYWDRPEHIGPADLPHKYDHPAIAALLRALGVKA